MGYAGAPSLIAIPFPYWARVSPHSIPHVTARISS
ncbi:hypothetical protein M2109_004021 [Paenibacillus sp. PastH-3]|nr:hypothetical protein [Paenibacillus sp. PastH-4]MDH6445813.1 hypothetical protein [Paenibacillus sp. PastF-4]MDH6529700.1 hypothetical protein [Paenibacillus sp. PastH-3]